MSKKYKIDKANKTVIFKFPSNSGIRRQVLDCCRTAHFNIALKHYVVPVNEYSIPRIRSVILDNGFVEDSQPQKEIQKFDYSVPPDREKVLREICEKRNFSYTPRNYQIEALNYALEKGNLIIGDDVGLGKTFEAILYGEVLKAFPILVIVPASVKYNWKEKWEEIVGAHRVVEAIESKKKAKNNWNAEVVIINYDIIGRKQGRGAVARFPELTEIDWRMIIFDEAHFMKTSKSVRTKAAFSITKKSKEAVIQLLTGTATMNRPVELWNLLRLVKFEKLFASNWKRFTEKFCGGHQSSFGWKSSGATNIFELNQLLRETCYIRREKREVLSEMPPVTKQVHKAPIDNRKDYNFARTDFIEWVRNHQGEEKAEKAMEAENLVALSAMRKLTIQGKLKEIIQYLDDWKEVNTEKLVVFGLHREPLETLAKRYGCQLIAGGVSSKQKQEIVKDFQNNDNVFLFGNMQSAGTGVDGLQNVASNMLILELPWRPSDLEQVIGRLDRSGQELPVTVTFMMAEDTIDFEMWEMLAEKEKITEAVNKGVDIDKGESGMRMVIRKILEKAK